MAINGKLTTGEVTGVTNFMTTLETARQGMQTVLARLRDITAGDPPEPAPQRNRHLEEANRLAIKLWLTLRTATLVNNDEVNP